MTINLFFKEAQNFMKILLSEEGVFPITRDEKGELLDISPNTGMPISGTIQGEGRLAGTPSLFIRLSGCNLRCIWDKGNNEYSICDTPHSVFGKIKYKSFEIEKIVSIIKQNLGFIKHIVITGGEPTLQAKPLTQLCKRIKEEADVHLTIETNGTIFDKELAGLIDLFSISPKLSSSNPTIDKIKKFSLIETEVHKTHDSKRIDIESLQSFIDYTKNHGKSLQFKFVVTKSEDAKEISSDFLNKLNGWNRDDIFIMPLGATKEELKVFTPVALEMAISTGWRFSPRMHVELFNKSMGV